MVDGDSGSDRRRALEEKKRQLAEMRAAKNRNEEDRKRALLSNSNIQKPPQENGSKMSLSSSEIHDILVGVGVEPEPKIERTPEKVNGIVDNGHSSPYSSQILGTSRSQALELSTVHTVAIPIKDSALYSKTTQTEDERFSCGEFSFGSQELYIEDEMNMDGYIRGRTHSNDLDSPNINDQLANLGFNFPRKDEVEAAPKEETPAKPQGLSEEERAQIMTGREFQSFFSYAAKVVERALAEEVDIFMDYANQMRSETVASDDRLVLSRTFMDTKWTRNRSVVGISFSESFPELMAVAYDMNPEAPAEPQGVVLVWNTKFKKSSPEYVFHCQSRLTSVVYAKFHSHLIMAGCYSGQICMWDNRVAHKKTPINKSPLSTSAHTHPVFSLAVVGTNNAHNLISISTDGKICSWNVDNLTQPVDLKELLSRQGKQIACLCMSFPSGDMNNVVVGSEDGHAYAVSRHAPASATAAAHEHTVFDGHGASVCGVAFHRANGAVDFAHLLLSASTDWTVKLWSTKDPQLRFSFESHKDYVFDVAWSPVHPAVFTSIDAEGYLFLWNLNEDTEGPVARIRVAEERGQLKKLSWSENGQQVCVGDALGNVFLFEVHENMYVLRSEEWTRFARVLADMKQTSEEMDEMSEVMSRLSSTSAPLLPNVNVSPRQNWP